MCEMVRHIQHIRTAVLQCECECVSPERVYWANVFVTYITYERTFSSMDTHVSLEIGFMCESFVTCITVRTDVLQNEFAHAHWADFFLWSKCRRTWQLNAIVTPTFPNRRSGSMTTIAVNYLLTVTNAITISVCITIDGPGLCRHGRLTDVTHKFRNMQMCLVVFLSVQYNITYWNEIRNVTDVSFRGVD